MINRLKKILLFTLLFLGPVNGMAGSIFSAHGTTPGALCDGVHDDSVAIQAALDTPGESPISFDGSSIPGWGGVCLASNLVTHLNDVVLEIGNTILQPPVARVPAWGVTSALGVSGMKIHGGTFNMLPKGFTTPPATNNYVIGVRFDGCTDCEAIGTKVLIPYGARGDGFYVGGKGGAVPNGGSTRTTIFNTEVSDPGRSCISGTQLDYLLVLGLTCRNALGDPGAGVNIEGNPGDTATHIQLLNNHTINTQIGLAVNAGKGLQGSNVLIAGNLVEDSRKVGILCNTFTNVVISGNTVVTALGLGMSVGGPTASTISQNVTVVGNLTNGMLTGTQLAGVRNFEFIRNTLPNAAPRSVPTGNVPQPVSGDAIFVDNVIP